jgi:hypothetical protein
MKSIQNTILIVSFFLIFTTISSCKKEAGEGGTSTIKGKVYVKDYNSTFTAINAEYYAIEEDVYIVYGDNDVYSDRFRTHYNGSYVFTNLKKGKYHVYAYSKDSTFTAPSGLIPIMKTIEIKSNNQTIIVEDIVILD